jgi:anti-anti-sigma regulatory factor
MVCRIDVAQDRGVTTVHVAGRLAGPTVDDLLRACDDASGKLRIDLSDLLSVDSLGVEALRRLSEDGAELFGVAQYLRHELGGRGQATS